MSSPLSSTSRRIHSLPDSSDASTSSTLADPRASSLFANTLSSPPSTARAVSNPTSTRPRRVPTAASGGFLLDNSSKRSSIDFPGRASSERDRDRDYATSTLNTQSSFRSRREKQKEYDNDPAKVVSLVLSEASRRKREAMAAVAGSKRNNTASGQQQPQQDPRYAPGLQPPVSPVRSRRESLGRMGRAASPTRSFLLDSSSRYGAGSPPPAPARVSFPTPSLTPIPFSEEQAWHTRKRSVGQEQLREEQKQRGFTDATMQRTLKAKQSLELGALYKELIMIDGERCGGGRKGYGYNPLLAIRNRKQRNVAKVKLNVGHWEDAGLVERWVEDVAVSASSPGGLTGAGGLPHPPPGETKIMKRPKMEWIVSPEELLADYYWMRTEEWRHDVEHELEQRKQINKRKSQGGVRTGDEMDKRNSIEVHPKKYNRPNDGFREYSYVTTTPSSSEEDTSYSGDDNESHSGSESNEEDSDGGKKKKKEPSHRRRAERKIEEKIRKLQIKKDKSKKALEEKLKKRDEEDPDWLQSEDDEKPLLPLSMRKPLDQPSRASIDIDDEYESAPTGNFSSPPKLSRPPRDSSPAVLPRSSLDAPHTSGFGLGIIPNDTVGDHIVPSIAISLSPPVVDDSDRDRIRPRAQSPSKDSGRDSLDLPDRHASNAKKSSEKPSIPTKLKTLLRSKHRDSAPPSPTESVTSSEDEGYTISASEMLDDAPRPSAPRPFRHRNHLRHRPDDAASRNTSPERQAHARVYKRPRPYARAHATSSAIVMRELAARAANPPSTAAARRHAGELDATLTALARHRHQLVDVRLPSLQARADGISAVISGMRPMLHKLADEAEDLESLVTTDLTRQVTAAREELAGLVRMRKRGRGRWVVMAGWALVEWALVGVLRVVRVVVWAVRVVRWTLGFVYWIVVGIGRWILWI